MPSLRPSKAGAHVAFALAVDESQQKRLVIRVARSTEDVHWRLAGAVDSNQSMSAGPVHFAHWALSTRARHRGSLHLASTTNSPKGCRGTTNRHRSGRRLRGYRATARRLQGVLDELLFKTGNLNLDRANNQLAKLDLPPCLLDTPLPPAITHASGYLEPSTELRWWAGGDEASTKLADWPERFGFHVERTIRNNQQRGVECGYIAAAACEELIHAISEGAWMHIPLDEHRQSLDVT